MKTEQIIKDFGKEIYNLHYNEMGFICIRGALIRDNQFMFNENKTNEWNDTICVFNKDGYFKTYDGTVDSGQYFIDNPLHVDGAGYVLPGITRIRLGIHKGKKAFVQVGNVRVYRDKNNNGIWEERLLGEATGGNLHAAHDLRVVGKSSALCTVPKLLWKDPVWNNEFVELAERSNQKSFVRLYIESRELALFIGLNYNGQDKKDWGKILYEHRQSNK